MGPETKVLFGFESVFSVESRVDAYHRGGTDEGRSEFKHAATEAIPADFHDPPNRGTAQYGEAANWAFEATGRLRAIGCGYSERPEAETTGLTHR